MDTVILILVIGGVLGFGIYAYKKATKKNGQNNTGSNGGGVVDKDDQVKPFR